MWVCCVLASCCPHAAGGGGCCCFIEHAQGPAKQVQREGPEHANAPRLRHSLSDVGRAFTAYAAFGISQQAQSCKQPLSLNAVAHLSLTIGCAQTHDAP